MTNNLPSLPLKGFAVWDLLTGDFLREYRYALGLKVWPILTFAQLEDAVAFARHFGYMNHRSMELPTQSYVVLHVEIKGVDNV